MSMPPSTAPTPEPQASSSAIEHAVVLRPSGLLLPGEHNATAFSSWRDFTASGTPALGFYLDGWDEQALHEWCSLIRRSAWWDRPLWAAATPGPGSALLDGIGPFSEALAAGERSLAVRRSLKLDPNALHFDERVLYFLYLRDGAQLQPLCDRNDAQLYRYPTIEALARDGDDVSACLATLTRRRLLEPAELIDRTRHCRTCGSAHIHYLDVCPHCSSIQIRKAPSLHCFTCGHVAPESDFHDDGSLSCPKCSTALRHIGVDYDRPLTQYACGSCHHVFVETSVMARCLDCRNTTEPNALDVREIASLRLSAHGRAALRAGQIRESFAALDAANYVEPAYFRRLLDWALATHARHKEMQFALMLVEFQNAAEVIEKQGAARVFLMLDEFARRLHELLRTSDLTTRTQEERLWLMLPFSHPEGLTARLQKVLQEQSSSHGDAALRVRIRHLQIPRDLRNQDSAAQLMARLQNEG
jgi:GGDEF domain-containing protein